MKLKVFLFIFILTSFNVLSGEYLTEIKHIQATKVGDSLNTIWIVEDISNSPCSDSNQLNRFTLTSDVQYSTSLAALMAKQKVIIFTTGNCINNIEHVLAIRVGNL